MGKKYPKTITIPYWQYLVYKQTLEDVMNNLRLEEHNKKQKLEYKLKQLEVECII